MWLSWRPLEIWVIWNRTQDHGQVVSQNPLYNHSVKVSPTVKLFNVHSSSQGGEIWANDPTKKPTKVTLFAMFLYNSENNKLKPIPNRSLVELSNCSWFKPFCRPFHSFVTAGLWSTLNLSYSSEADMRLDYQMLLKSHTPYLTGWILPWLQLTERTSSSLAIEHIASRIIAVDPSFGVLSVYFWNNWTSS